MLYSATENSSGVLTTSFRPVSSSKRRWQIVSAAGSSELVASTDSCSSVYGGIPHVENKWNPLGKIHHSRNSTPSYPSKSKMEVFKDFPEDFAKSFQTSTVTLSVFNIRYLEHERPFLQKYWRFSYISLIIFCHIFTLVIHIPEVLTEEKISQFAFLLPNILVTIHVIMKCIVFIPKTKQLSEFIRQLGTLWRVKLTPSQNKEKDALLSRLNSINKGIFWVSVFGANLYMLLPLFETLVRRFILAQKCDLLLPINWSYPFDPTTKWLTYILVYIFQLYSMILLVSPYLGAALIMITSCGMLTTEFLMLKHDLVRVKPKINRGRSYNATTDDNDGLSIEAFVERHQKLLRLSRQLDNVFNGMVFIDLLFVGITTCAFTFMGQFARDKTYKMVSYIGAPASMISVLYLCYYGELLTRASASIGDMAYENLWYKGGKQYKMAIWLIIKISQKPCCLTSLRYAVVSMSMFTKVMSTTWSYFSLMNSVYSDE